MAEHGPSEKADMSEVRASLREAHRQVQRVQRFVYDGRAPTSWPLLKRFAINRAQTILIRLLIWEQKHG